jgi:PilZ domain-containing protein
MPTAPSAERRDVRFVIAADVLSEDLQTHARKAGKIENISGSGCYIKTADPWLMWTRIRLWIVYHCQQFEAEGSVVHTAGGKGMGISFESITAPNEEMLTAWLRSLPS